MELALFIAVLTLLSATVGLIFPFSPFERRRHAVLTLLACFIVIGFVALEARGRELPGASVANAKQPY